MYIFSATIIIISRYQFFVSWHFSVSWNLFLSDLMILMFLIYQKSLKKCCHLDQYREHLYSNRSLTVMDYFYSCTYSRQIAVCWQWRLQTVEPTETPVNNQTVCSGPALSLVSDRVIRSSVICTAHSGFTFPVRDVNAHLTQIYKAAAAV